LMGRLTEKGEFVWIEETSASENSSFSPVFEIGAQLRLHSRGWLLRKAQGYAHAVSGQGKCG
jgi:hypothetical protein